MDELTQRVREMYMQYPFPNEDYNMMYGSQMLRYFYTIRGANPRSFLENATILDAGCGTGSVSVGLATQFPGAQITSFDLCDNSLKKARERAQRAGVANIEFVQGNLLDFDLNKQFDAIFNIGVLHHLAEPTRGLANLRKHLKPDGRLILWLYGTYGRYRLNLNQRMLSVLLKAEPDLAKKVEYTKDILQNGPQDGLQCHFNVANSAIEDKWEESRDWVLTKDEWIVDQFLHYNERTVNIEDILKLLAENGLVLDKWLGIRDNIAYWSQNPEIQEHYNNLTAEEKLIVLDLLYKPNYYTVAAKLK